MPILHACPDCGKLTPNPRCPKHTKAKQRKRYARQDASRRARGKRHGSTRGYRKARAEALTRDGHRCTYVEDGRRCKATGQLETHHRNGNPRDDRVENLATVCPKHHDLIERKLIRQRGEREPEIERMLSTEPPVGYAVERVEEAGGPALTAAVRAFAARPSG